MSSSSTRPPWLDPFRMTIARRLGLWFDEDKFSWLEEVGRRRSLALRHPAADYVRELNYDGSPEWNALAQELTVGETYFFRHSEQMAAYLQVALPQRAARREGRPLRLLSVGCSSGEEPYSLVMLARHAGLGEQDTKVMGLDLNPASLRKAKAGRYTRWSLRETPEELHRRWFTAQGKEQQLDPAVMRSVEFRQCNLADPAPDLWQPRLYDIIFCRNVLIYFTPAQTRQVVQRMVDSLVEGGFLFLGHAETLRGLCDEMELINTHNCFYYRKPQGQASVGAGWPPPAIETPALPEDWVGIIEAASERIRLMGGAEGGSDAIGRSSETADLGQVRDLMEGERYGEALTRLRCLPPEQQEQPDSLLLEAVLQIQVNDFGQGEALCRRLLEAGHAPAGAHYLLALCREGHGDNEAAAAEHRAAVRLDPGFAMPRLHLGLLSRRARDLTAARRELEQAMLLLQGEEPPRLRLYGGGFSREALVALCRSELAACTKGRR